MMAFCRLLPLLLLFGGAQARKSEEVRLVDMLKQRYEALGTETRPVFHVDDAVDVQIGLTLIYVEDVRRLEGNRKWGELTASFYITHMWKDVHLRWDPKDFGGINVTRLRIESIWRPDIKLYNSLESHVDMDTLAVVGNDGSVTWIPKARITVPAQPSNRGPWPGLFGWDSQEEGKKKKYDWSSEFKLGSWSYQQGNLDVHLLPGTSSMDLESFLGNVEIVDASAKRETKTYPCCPTQVYPTLTFNLKFNM